MATRMKMLKLLQETHGLASVTDRRVNGRSPGLFVLEFRHRQRHPEKKSKLLIPIAMRDLPDVPHPVKIQHVPATATLEKTVQIESAVAPASPPQLPKATSVPD